MDIPENSPTSNLVIPKGIKPSDKNYEKYKDAILIASAAFTNKGISESFWEMLTERLIGLGYKVYNNTGGLDYDKIIKGTEPFLSSTQDLILNAPLFRHVIAIRSGFTENTGTNVGVSFIAESEH